MAQPAQLFAGSVTWVVRLRDGLAGSALPASPEALHRLMRANTVCPADCRLDEGLRAFLRAVLADDWLPL